MNDLLFVYGTLRRDAAGNFSPHLAGRADFVSAARARGALVRVSWYPGLVAGNAEWVEGELYRLREPEAVLPSLDEYEGAEFARREVPVRRESGEEVSAWSYFFQGPVKGLEKISSGVFLPEEHASWS